MAYLDELISRVTDPALKQELTAQVAGLVNRRNFGLVFEDHIPERVELPGFVIRRGDRVVFKDDPRSSVYRVIRVDSTEALISPTSHEDQQISTSPSKLAVVREFGDAIHPGLSSVGSIERGGDKPFHTVINSENYHALETLLYPYEGKVDCIYIDPPYNTGATSWKYNNNYVDKNDSYRHSKWLAFMERRLRVAKRLLNPQESMLIVTIDSHEVHHLGVLLEQIFPTEVIQMVSIAINRKGVAKAGLMSSVEEYAFFVYVGDQKAVPGEDNLFADVDDADAAAETRQVDPWASMLRRGTESKRSDRKDCFYPLHVDPTSKKIVKIGDAIPLNVDRSSVVAEPGIDLVWPIRKNGDEGRWQLGPDTARQYLAIGYIKTGVYNRARSQWAIKYLPKGEITRINEHKLRIVGREPAGGVILESAENKKVAVKTIWNRVRHNAGTHGSDLISNLLPGRSFPFPKSVYAVLDTIRIAVGNKPDALVLDFFSGSGTTLHSLAMLNREDGGRRRSIIVTNNEVSPEEALELSAQGLRPGEPAWEARGICRYITIPRIQAAITGKSENGSALTGSYLDGHPMSDGFEENVEFFDLTYEDQNLIALGRKFEAIAPILWLKAGASGARIDTIPEAGWALPETARYGILFDISHWTEFVHEVSLRKDVKNVFVVTDSSAAFQQVSMELPPSIDATQLYEDYLRTFRINTKGRS